MAAPPSPPCFQLQRFTKAQAAPAHGHCQALKELRHGQKRSCWIWWIVPVPAKRQMSTRARRFAIASDAEAAAYLRFEHDGVALRANLVEIFGTILSQLQKRSSVTAKRAAAQRNGDVPHGYSVARAMLGSVDAAKLLCSLTMWRRVAELVQDEELLSLVLDVLAVVADVGFRVKVPDFALQYDFYAVSPSGALERMPRRVADLFGSDSDDSESDDHPSPHPVIRSLISSLLGQTLPLTCADLRSSTSTANNNDNR